MTNRRVAVFGPAYLDRVLRVDRPLIDPALGPLLDQSVDGAWKFGAESLARTGRSRRIRDRDRVARRLAGADRFEFAWRDPIRPGVTGRRPMRGLSWHDDLGGMGAGYAAALGGRLCSALGLGVRPDEPGDLAAAG